MLPYFSPEDVRVAYACRFYFDWQLDVRPGSGVALRDAPVERLLEDAAARNSFHILGRKLEFDRLKTLLSLEPFVAPSSVSRLVKGSLSAGLRHWGAPCRWSRGTFFRSNGNMTDAVVAQYVASQYERHGVPVPGSSLRVSYRHPGKPEQLRRTSRATFEYNVHLVFVTHRRREILDYEIADDLLAYWLRIVATRGWVPWNVEIVWNHAHLFLGLMPEVSPGGAALSLLNNAEYFLQRRYSAGFRDTVDRTIWTPGFYVGTVGCVRTAQYAGYLDP